MCSIEQLGLRLLPSNVCLTFKQLLATSQLATTTQATTASLFTTIHLSKVCYLCALLRGSPLLTKCWPANLKSKPSNCLIVCVQPHLLFVQVCMNFTISVCLNLSTSVCIKPQFLLSLWNFFKPQQLQIIVDFQRYIHWLNHAFQQNYVRNVESCPTDYTLQRLLFTDYSN